jgi:hypothetical protein
MERCRKTCLVKRSGRVLLTGLLSGKSLAFAACSWDGGIYRTRRGVSEGMEGAIMKDLC